MWLRSPMEENVVQLIEEAAIALPSLNMCLKSITIQEIAMTELGPWVVGVGVILWKVWAFEVIQYQVDPWLLQILVQLWPEISVSGVKTLIQTGYLEADIILWKSKKHLGSLVSCWVVQVLRLCDMLWLLFLIIFSVARNFRIKSHKLKAFLFVINC